MARLTIGDRTVTVDDSFLSLSPAEQAATVEEIAGSLGISAPAKEPELTAGRAAGLAGRAGVQAVPGAVLGLPALVYDAIQQGANFGYQGIDAVLGTDLAARHDRGRGGVMGTSRALGEVGRMGADALGLPTPETSGERVAVSGLQTAAEALGGAGLAGAAGRTLSGAPARVAADLAASPGTQAVIGGLSGGGAQVAAENDVNPLIGMGAGMALGLGGVAAGQGIRSGVRAANRALLRTPDDQAQAAADTIRQRAADPDAALQALDDGAGAELVPGSRPTTFQATGDEGLGALEREARTRNQGAFMTRREEQNAARLGSLRSTAGQGDPAELVGALRRELADIDASTLRAEETARTAAQDAAERFRPSDDAEGLGRALRGRMVDAETAARNRESALWNAVDPDGTLTVVTQPLKARVRDVYGNLTESARLGLSGLESRFAERVGALRNIDTFKELIDLNSEVKAAMRAELRSAGRTKTHGRLAQMSKGIQDVLETTAAERVANDPAAASRVGAYFDEFGSAANARGAGRETSDARAVSAGGLPGMAGSQGAVGGGSGGAARAKGVSGQAKRQRLSLTQFIAKNGGLPLDAEATARDFGSVNVGRHGRLARPNGRSIDGYWRNKLIDEGYLPPDADGGAQRDITRELFDLLEQERAGRKTFSMLDDVDEGARAVDGPEAELVANAKMVRDVLKDNGIREADIHGGAVDDAAEMLARGDETDPFTAYERAVIGMDEDDPARVVPFPDRETSGPAEDITQAFRDDPEAGERYRDAAQATRERVSIFNKGTAGQILRPGEDRASFRMGDASVASTAFRAGPTGGERIKAVIAAGGDRATLADMAAASLRKSALKDGIIDPAKFEAWRRAHEPALNALPQEVRARFANASLASKAYEQAAIARKTRLDAFNKSVLGQVAGVDVDDLPRTIGGILNSRDSAAKMRTLVQAANKNPQAKEGLRRAVAEWIEGRFISNKEEGTSGLNRISANAFQSFVKDNEATLRQVFSVDDLQRMRAVADDIRRAERSLVALKDPAGPNTASDLQAGLDKLGEKAQRNSLLLQVLASAGGGALIGGTTGAVTAGTAAAGRHWLGAIRAAGMRKVDDLVLEMLLDPRLARAALVKTSPQNMKAAEGLLAKRLAALSPFATAGAVDAGR